MIQEFIVERPHPDFRSRGYERSRHSAQYGLAAILPVTVEVEAEERNARYYYTCDCSSVYRLTPRSVRFLKSREVLRKGLSEDNRPCVCLCMGNLA